MLTGTLRTECFLFLQIVSCDGLSTIIFRWASNHSHLFFAHFSDFWGIRGDQVYVFWFCNDWLSFVGLPILFSARTLKIYSFPSMRRVTVVLSVKIVEEKVDQTILLLSHFLRNIILDLATIILRWIPRRTPVTAHISNFQISYRARLI